MANLFLDAIVKLSSDAKLNGDSSKKLADKGCQFITDLRDSYYRDESQLKRIVMVSGAAVTTIGAIFLEAREIKKKEKLASKLFDVPLKSITGDCTKFITSKENYSVYVQDFQYDASISLDKMRDLKAIWGDANLEKLHDFQDLNLRVVMGNTYLSDAENMGQINKLRVITGDLHIGNLEILDYLNRSIYIGGHVYHDGMRLAIGDPSSFKKMIKH